MAISTDPVVQDKRTRINNMRAYHQVVFDALGIPEALFIPKMAYKPHGKDETYISFFYSEVSREVDIYTEFASRDYISEDPEHRLYKWTYNPHFATEYEVTDEPVVANRRYLVPVGELTVVSKPQTIALTPAKQEFSLEADPLDEPLSSLTVRDLAALVLRKPELTKKHFIQNLILK